MSPDYAGSILPLAYLHPSCFRSNRLDSPNHATCPLSTGIRSRPSAFASPSLSVYALHFTHFTSLHLTLLNLGCVLVSELCPYISLSFDLCILTYKLVTIHTYIHKFIYIYLLHICKYVFVDLCQRQY